MLIITSVSLSHAETIPDFSSTVSQEFCDWFYENPPSTEALSEMMSDDIQNNSATQYLLSKFPDSAYTFMVEESMPPRFTSYYIYENDNVFVTLDYFFQPCFYPVFPSQFVYHNKILDVDIGITTDYDRDLHENVGEDILLETIRDSALHVTHEKWINHKGSTVYAYEESVDPLTDRGYLTERIDFFDLENVDYEKPHNHRLHPDEYALCIDCAK